MLQVLLTHFYLLKHPLSLAVFFLYFKGAGIAKGLVSFIQCVYVENEVLVVGVSLLHDLV